MAQRSSRIVSHIDTAFDVCACMRGCWCKRRRGTLSRHMATSDIIALAIFAVLAIGLPILGLTIVRQKRKPTGGAGGHKKHRRK